MSDQTAYEELPSAHDVRRLLRRTNWTVAVGVLAIGIVCVIAAMYAASGRAASQDSANATRVQLASQGRNACITERRNAELDAIGDLISAGLDAQIAGLVLRDQAELQKALDRKVESDRRRSLVSDSLAPDTLNRPVDEGGCGPPILTLADLKADR